MTYQFNSSESSWFNLGESVSAPSYSVQSTSVVISNGPDNSESIKSALQNYDVIEFPPGIFLLKSEIQIPFSNKIIKGSGIGKTILKCDDSMTFGHAFILIGKNNCIFQDLTIDANASGRGLTISSGYNGINIQGNNNRFLNIEVKNTPLFGMLIDGNIISSDQNSINGCIIADNGGTGLALNRAFNTKIISNIFNNNGFENLTVDIASIGNTVALNHFYRHRGGCGNIGWDDSDGSIFIGNFINSESTTDPAVGTRIGLTINSEAGVTTGAVIVGNVIINNLEYGIYLRNRSGQPNPNPPPNWNPSKPGDAMIASNYIRNSGIKDIRIGDTDELITLGSNNYLSIQIDDPDGNNVRLPSGDVAIETKLNSSQTVNVNAFTKVLYTNVVYSRNITASNGSLTIPCGGFYSIDAKTRVTLTNSSGVSFVQLKIITPSGTKISNELVNGESVVEISASISKYMIPGEVYIEIYASGSSGTVSLDSGDENWFSCTLTG